MPVTTNTRKLAALLGASGAGIANYGTLTSAAIGEVIVAGDIAAGAVDTAELATDAVTTVKIANDQVTGAKIENSPTIAANLTVAGDIIPSTPLSNRNMIINGAMQFAQRVKSVGSGTHGIPYKAVDRFRCTDAMDVAQVTYEQTDLTGANIPAAGLMTAHKVSLYGGGTYIDVPAAAEYHNIETRLEGLNISHLLYGTASAKTITLSFYVRSNKNGVWAVQAYTPNGTAYDIGTTYTVANTDWQRVIWTIPGNTSGTINNASTAGMHIRWWLAAGTDSTATSNTSWGAEATGRRAYGQTAQLFSDSGNYIEFTGVQLELGSNATPFEHRSYGEELRRCQRYFWRSGGNVNYEIAGIGVMDTASNTKMLITHPVAMRGTPALTVNNATGFYHASKDIDGVAAISMDVAGISTSMINVNGSFNSIVGYGGRLYNGSDTTATLDFNSEL